MMDQTPTYESLLALLQRKQLTGVAHELEVGITTFEEFKIRSEAQWGKIAGTALGIDLYNHMNPTPVAEIIHESEILRIIHPEPLHNEIVDSVANLETLLNDFNFTGTFEMEASHDMIVQAIAKKAFTVRFIFPNAYNAILTRSRKDQYMNDEFGWFDPNFNENSVYINLLYYQVDASNLEFLKLLAFVTVVHELQHFLRFHLKELSPTQPLPSVYLPVLESGDAWEYRNLGGRMGILSRENACNLVKGLYLTFLEDGQEKQSWIGNPVWSATANSFDFSLLKTKSEVPEHFQKCKILHKCIEIVEPTTSNCVENPYIMRRRPNDKKY